MHVWPTIRTAQLSHESVSIRTETVFRISITSYKIAVIRVGVSLGRLQTQINVSRCFHFVLGEYNVPPRVFDMTDTMLRGKWGGGLHSSNSAHACHFWEKRQ